MCKVLEFDNFLALALKYNVAISFKDVISVIDDAKKEPLDLVIDASRESVECALRHYSKIFVKDEKNKRFVRANGSNAYFDSQYIEDEFLAWIPEDVQKKIDEIFSQKRLLQQNDFQEIILCGGKQS